MKKYMMKTLNKKSKSTRKSSKSKVGVGSEETSKPKVNSPAVDIVFTIKQEDVVEKPKKKSTEKQYFTQETEDYIVKFNKEEDMDVRNEIYNEHIKYPFEKLVENVFNTFKFSYFDVGALDVQKETLSHLVANISKFQENKGKAFSYFSIIAKHYLIFNNNSNYKRFNQHVDISEEKEDNTIRLQTVDSHHKQSENKEFLKMMIDYWDKNLNVIFTKPRDFKIAEAVIELFRNSDRLEFFNKKALYLYIREISNCKTQQITKVINKMKDYQYKICKSYTDTGRL